MNQNKLLIKVGIAIALGWFLAMWLVAYVCTQFEVKP